MVRPAILTHLTAGLAGHDWVDDDDSAYTFTRVLSLPKLILALETWHVITLKPDLVRLMYSRFNVATEQTKVIFRVC